jgi:release factor glutamine methyltransferase
MRFGALEVVYDHRVLRPRPWTAAQSHWAAELLADAPPGPVLELCAGVGHIGLLAIAATDRRLVAVDASGAACELARRNAVAAGLADQVEVRHSVLDDALATDERFPVIVADPPWVPTRRTGDHPEDPVFAIDGGADGLAVASRCVEVARTHLHPDGALLLQLGTLAQADELERRLRSDDAGLLVAEVRRPDPNGVVLCVRRTGVRVRSARLSRDRSLDRVTARTR